MAERRAGAKGRRLGSSRRRQLRGAPGPEEEPPPPSWPKARDFLGEGLVASAHPQERRAEGFPRGAEEPPVVSDGRDADGRFSAEALAGGLRQVPSSRTASRSGPSSDGADGEERKRFAAFVDQLGTDDAFGDQEIWQLWVKLQQDEPQLLGNLEDFLAKMRCRIQEAKREKEALEVLLNKRMAEHGREVQQLCEALEQQMCQETQRLEQESEARSHQHSTELWRALDARESEAQRLLSVQTELETRCRSLRSTQEAASTENQQLERSNRALEERLQHVHLQLRETQGRLQAAQAAVATAATTAAPAQDRPATELPGETPPSPQTSLEKNEKYCSGMQIRLGSQSGNRPPKSGHHVVWEKVPGEISISGPLPRATSVQQDPFPEFLKEEWFSDQSSLLREMNDAVVALSKELKLQGPADPVPAGDVSLRPWEDTTMHGTAPGALQETLASLSSQETLQGDLLQEGPAQAALGAQDVTPAGASESAGHRTAQERGGEQGESPKGAGQGQEDTQSIFFVQGQGTATEEQTLEEAEDLQGAQGESTEAGAQVLTEVEEAGLTQEKTGWEATRPPGDAEKAVLTQGENLDADLRPAEPQELELVLGGCFTAGVLRWAAAQEERVQPLSKGAELGEEADSCMLRSEKLELKLGEHLDPEVQCLGEAGRPGAVPGESPSTDLQLLAAGQDVEAEQAGSGDADGLEVAQTLQLAPTEGQSVGLAAWPSEAQSPRATQGHVLDAGMPLTQAQMPEAKQGESNDAACQHEAEEGEVTQSVEAELQPGAEAAVGDAAPGGRGDAGLQPGDEGEQLDVVQGGSAGPAVQPPEEAEPLDVMQEEEAGADVQPVEEAKSAGGLQGQSSDANVQSLAEAEELAFTPGEGTEAELQPPSEAAVGGRGDAGLQPGDEGEQLDVVQGGSAGPAVQPPEEAEPLDVMQEEEAGADVQPVEEAKSAGGLQGQSSDANVQSLAEAEELAFTPGEGTEAELQPPSEAGSPVLYGLGVRPGEGDAAGVQPPKVDESLGAWEALSPDVKVLPLIVVEEPKFTLSESVVADLGPLGTAQTWEGMPGQILALEAHAFPQGDLTDGAAHAEVQPLAGAATQGAQPHDQAIANTETPDLEVMLGAFAGADGQILEETQILEITQGERVDACAQAAEGAQKLKVVQTEKIHPEFLPQAPGALNGEKTQGKSADLEIYSLETPKAEVMQGDKTSADVQEEPKEMMLGESTGPALYSFKIHGVEMLQGERTNAEVRPLDEVQDLEVVQGASLEADVRFFTQTEGLQLKQGCNAGAAMVASSISEVPLPIRGQKHETLTQEDVLVPDLQRLGILGQEQVSTQADKVRPDVAPEQLLPKEKPLRVMESEQIAAEHPELPKEKVPPASTLCARVRREEHMGSDPVGAFLGDSLLSDVANSRTQPLTRLSGEPGNGLDVGQRDGKQDVRLQTSQEVKPSPEDPGAVMADGARSSAGVTPETWPDPDHLYNVLFVGDSHVGKTSFLYRLHANSFNPHLTATVGLDYQIKNLIVDNKLFALRLWDSAGQERYHSITKQFFRKADGVVLMYDITSEYSFADVRYWLSCIQEGAEDGIAILLLGNKTDCAAERQVPTKEGERLAQEHQLTFYECSAASGHNVSESMVSLIRLLKIRDDQLKSKVEEEPKPTQKKKGCC